MEVTYHAVGVGEEKALLNLMDALDHETKYMLYEPGERSGSLDRLKALVDSSQQNGNFLLVAELDGELVGFISSEKGWAARTRHSAYIVVGIRKKCQGRGIGTEFFRRLDAWAHKNRIRRLELTVMRPNTVAKHLYEKNGFVVEGIKKDSMLVDGEYVDEFYMAKLLGVAVPPELNMLIRSYWQAVADQDAVALREYFTSDAHIRWHNTNEDFTVDEFIRANCEYPGAWNGEVERLESSVDTVTTVTRVWAKDEDLSFHVVSFITLDETGKITEIDEYWGDDGPAPQWRLDKHIGKPIHID